MLHKPDPYTESIRLKCVELALVLLPEDLDSGEIVQVLANAEAMVQYVLTGQQPEGEEIDTEERYTIEGEP